MSPTAAGRYCATCATEVVDFTRMSEAEVVAFLTERRGQRVCAFMAAPVPPPVKLAEAPRRWLLAALALLSGPPLAAARLPPQPRPMLLAQNPAQAIITIRGVVLDDSLNVPVGGACVYIGRTQYGAVANVRGEFSVSFPADWEPAKTGSVTLRIGHVPFALVEQTVVVNVRDNPTPAPLTIRQLSVPQRGFRKGKAVLEESPAPVPEVLFQRAGASSTVTIRGVVLDDSLRVAVPGALVYVGSTGYGAIANERGEFTLTFAPDWEPAHGGSLDLRIVADPFQFQEKRVLVDWRRRAPQPEVIRLASVPMRGHVKGEAVWQKPPVAPPKVRPKRK